MPTEEEFKATIDKKCKEMKETIKKNFFHDDKQMREESKDKFEDVA